MEIEMNSENRSNNPEWVVTFLNEDTEQIGCDCFNAPTELAAKHDFREYYYGRLP